MIKPIRSALLDDLVMKARSVPRMRINHNVHEVPEDPVQRLFVAAEPGSYFRPHRHPDKGELALAIRGLFDVVVFDDAGQVTQRITIGADAETIGFDMPPNLWHSWVPLMKGSVFFEVKQGPYDPLTISEFAPWSVEEGSPGAADYALKIKNAGIGDIVAI